MNFWAETFFHIAVFSAVLPILYFGYVGPSQNQRLSDDLFHIAKPELGDYGLVTGTVDITSITALMNTISGINLDLSQTQTNYSKKNSKISLAVIFAFGLGIPVLIGSAITIEYYYGTSVYQLLISNLIFACFIIISEFAIVSLFLNNYIILDAEFLKSNSSQYFSKPPISWKHDIEAPCDYTGRFMKQTFPSFITNALKNDS